MVGIPACPNRASDRDATKRSRFLLLFLLLGVLNPFLLRAEPSSTGDPTAEAVQLLAFGTIVSKPGTRDEPAASPESLLRSHAEALRIDAEQAERVAERAYLDAFGIAPDAQGAPAGASTGNQVLYHQLLAEHLTWLAAQPEVSEAVIHRAYQWTIHREAYPEELAYWKEHGPLSYSLLVGCLEDWARRNQPGLMVTGGTPTISINCPYLQTLRVSPELAATLRTAIHLAPVVGKHHHVIAPGAEAVVSSGGIHFVAVGAPALRDASRRRKGAADP